MNSFNMNFKISKVLLFCFVICLFTLCCSKSIGSDDPPSGYNYCSYEGLFIIEGESVPAPRSICSQVRCNTVNPLSISKLTCDVFQKGPECSDGDYDYKKYFPQCCPKACFDH